MASLTLTYVLWLFFGWLGIHHVYLGRCNQAFVWFATLGGGFGIGWLRDLWRIPYYVRWSNADKDFQKEHLDRMAKHPVPDCGIFRFCGMLVMGALAGGILSGMVPEYTVEDRDENRSYFLMCHISFITLLISGASWGVYKVANIGEFRCSYYMSLAGSLGSLPWLLGSSSNIFMTTFLSALLSWYKGLRWRPLKVRPENGSKRLKENCKNFSVYLVTCVIWLSVLSYGIYFNAHITVKGQERIPVREAINNFFTSPAWKKTKDTLYTLYQVYRHNGWQRLFTDARDILDFSGEINASNVLGLPRNASQEEINKHCRKLARENHPDRYKSQTEKDEAQERFIEIQDACSKLSKTKSRRAKMSRTSEKD